MLRDTLVVIIGAVIFSFILLNFLGPKTKFQNIISPLAQGVEGTKNLITSFKGKNLKNVVETSQKGTRGIYAIVIKNLRTGESFSQNEKKVFEPASLYKLWVMGTTFELIKEGKLSEDKILSKEIPELNKIFNIPQDEAEETEGTITINVSDALYQMITISHNYAALLLVSEVRNSRVTSFIKKQDLKNSSLGEPPKTTASDIALFFEKVYQGTMIDGEYSKKMLDLLTKQKLNDRIPKLLPNEVDVAHKTGEIDGFKHDAGIIFGKDPILLVVLSESESPQGAAGRIAELSRNVFNYFEEK